ncbi:MAG: hydrolase TatD [Candidatus Amoebophilus sp. 36-38]|nr:MAG: hydrolase TatD [Candidatus Amoebophilus sp. 36-38]
MELIDTHAHLYDEDFLQDQSQVIARSLQAGVSKILLPNIDVNTIAPMLALEAQYPNLCAAMIGLHPCYIQEDVELQLYHIESWLAKRSFIAMGEIGMDLYRDKTYQSLQQEAFETQLNWAKKYKLPIVIHTRQAFNETKRILEKYQDGTLKGVFHCFSGSLAEAAAIIALGFHIGIGGITTFKNAGLAQVVSKLELKYLVLETDSPYLAPTPYRGKRNEPSYLPYIAAAIAQSQQVDVEMVAAITTANAKEIFGIK